MSVWFPRSVASRLQVRKGFYLVSCQAANKQLQRTVQTVSRRGTRASFHYARAPRWLGQRAAAELRR
jgi:hypothetical protein